MENSAANIRYFFKGVKRLILRAPRFLLSLFVMTVLASINIIRYCILFSFPLFFIKVLGEKSRNLDSFRSRLTLTAVAFLPFIQIYIVYSTLFYLDVSNIKNSYLAIYCYLVTAHVVIFAIYYTVTFVIKKIIAMGKV